MSDATVAAGLLPDVKNYLNVTWDDPDGDRKLTGIISRGMAYMQRRTSRPLGFEEGTLERALLLNYCMYDIANALDQFGKNYKEDLITFNVDEAVNAAVDAAGAQEGAG